MNKTKYLGFAIFILIAIAALTLINMQNTTSITGKKGNLNFAEASTTYKIILYTKKACGYCSMAKDFFTNHNIPYELIDITNNNDLHQQLINKTGQVTVPYVFINDKFVGGYTDLMKIKFD